MIMMPICESSVIAKPLEKTSGSTAKTSAVPPQTNQRPTSKGAKRIVDATSALPRSHQPLGPEDQDQHQQQVRQYRRDLRQLERPEAVQRRPGVDAQAERLQERDRRPVDADREGLHQP